jgi:hypothetical protein
MTSGLVAAIALGAIACAAQSAEDARQSYFEFGTVAEVGTHTVEVQTFDAKTRKIVQHSFMRTHDTRMDALKVGDPVEVIYTANGGEWTARRLVALPSGFPTAGPAPMGGATLTASVAPSGTAPVAPSGAASTSGVSTGWASAAPATKPKNKGALPVAPAVRVAKAPTTVGLGTKSVAKVAPVTPVPLGTKSVPHVAPVTPVPMGISAGYSSPAPVPVTRTVAREEPTAACHQSDPDWPKEPLRIAVLDFRYPTEREEAHDLTLQSGGSGMAVADLVYTRLNGLPQYAIDRGDRRRLDRSDIAGAARLGRELGADAVLEGTFFPLEDPPAADGTEGKVRGYELHAGLVDTCTGQVLLKLASVICPPGVSPSAGGVGCTALSVTTKDAEDPETHAAEFNAAIAALLYPLEHNGGTVGQMGPAGVVVRNESGTMIVRLASGMNVRPGEQLAVHASRLAKNPTTYTLQDLHDQEIGRFTVRNVQGAMATGTFAGDMPALAGDGLETVTN